jgi:membrane-associated protease RseP (regulator of RpoE activity)
MYICHQIGTPKTKPQRISNSKSHKLIMQTKKVILSALLAIATTGGFAQGLANNPRDTQAQQQGYYSQPYAFVQAQGGLNTTLASGNVMKPTFSIAGGYMFSQAIGLRLHLNGMNSKNGFENVGDKYQFKYINTNLDLMVNLTNFGKNPSGPINIYFVAGAGLAYCWNNDEFANIASKGYVNEHISNA